MDKDHAVGGSAQDWYVASEGSDPIGPVSTDLLIRGFAAGRVPSDALVCPVGDSRWRPVREVVANIDQPAPAGGRSPAAPPPPAPGHSPQTAQLRSASALSRNALALGILVPAGIAAIAAAALLPFAWRGVQSYRQAQTAQEFLRQAEGASEARSAVRLAAKAVEADPGGEHVSRARTLIYDKMRSEIDGALQQDDAERATAFVEDACPALRSAGMPETCTANRERISEHAKRRREEKREKEAAEAVAKEKDALRRKVTRLRLSNPWGMFADSDCSRNAARRERGLDRAYVYGPSTLADARARADVDDCVVVGAPQTSSDVGQWFACCP